MAYCILRIGRIRHSRNNVQHFLNHLIMQEFANSLDLNQQWSERLGAFTELGKVNSPGNDVFNSGDIDLEDQRLHDYYEKAQVRLASAKQLSRCSLP